MNIYTLGIILFIISVAIIELVIFAYRNAKVVKESKIKKRMKKYVYVEDDSGTGNIVKNRVMSEVPFLNQFILNTPGILRLDQLVLQANAGYPVGFYILLALLLGVLGYLVPVIVFRQPHVVGVLLGIVSTYLPVFYLNLLKNQRVEKFKKQFHVGLDSIARGLRSGHAFTTAMKLAAKEFDDPLGPEFEETLNEVNFGISIPDALKHLSERIDCPEIKYFVVAVLIQRSSGGNLAEVIEALASVIRQKYSFEGKLKTLTAEARLSALVLILLPFFVGGYIFISNRDYLTPLFTTQIGQMMLGFAAVLMALGVIVMKHMVEIEV